MTQDITNSETDRRNELIEKIRIKIIDINYMLERIQKCCPDQADTDGLTIQELEPIYDDLVKGEFILDMFRCVMIDEDDWETIA